MLNRSIPPDISLPDSFDIIKANTITLENGILLHSINAGSQEVIRLELIFKAGTKYENFRGSSYFTTKMVAEGTTSHNAKEIVEYLDLYGAFYELHHGPDRVNLTFYSLKKYLKEVALMARDLILNANFPSEELSNFKNVTLQNLKVNLSKTNYLASHKFKEVIFGINHPYGKSLNEQDIENVEKSSLINFYSAFIKDKPFDIVLSGNIDSEVKKCIESNFGNIKVHPINLYIPADSNNFITDNFITILKEDSLQSSLRIGFKSISKKHPDYFLFVVLNEIFGGYFGSRLMKNIREDKGFTYGISSNLINYEDETYFAIGADVKKEYSQQTLDEIEKEINILRNKLIPSEELETVKNYMIGSFLGSINTPFSLADKFKSLHYFNLDYSFYDRYLSAIRNVNSNVLIDTANKYLNFESMTKVIVGGLE